MNHLWVVEFWIDGRWQQSVNVRLTRKNAIILAASFRRADLGSVSGETCRYRVRKYVREQT
jgi:hypothetical protein